MAKKSSHSIRARRVELQAQRRRQRVLWGVVGIGGLLMIVGLFAWVRQANAPQLNDVILPESLEPPSNAEGKAWGPVDAAVLIEDFSDFQ